MAMPTLEEILTIAYNAGASDIHITVGLPPIMRLNGHLMKLDYPVLTANDTLALYRYCSSYCYNGDSTGGTAGNSPVGY